MCMITYVPANIEIPWDGIENGSIFNDDGHGWAVASKKGLQVGKSMSYDIAAITLAQAREEHGPDSLVMFHSRFATHGEKTEFNVHPFYVQDQTVMAHNGILPHKWQPKFGIKEKRSDTRIFADEVGREFSRNGVPSRRGGKAMGTMIGSANKLVFLTAKDGQPKVRIVNAHQGVFTEGVWYSNNGFEDSQWNWRGWSKYDSAASSSKASTNTDAKVTYMNRETDCSNCGEINSIDKAAGICAACEFCIDCKEMIWDCLCYSPAGKFGADEDEGSPLNPQFVTAGTAEAAANNAALAANDKAVELWTPYTGIGAGFDQA